jgi:hypothetical protein
MVWHGVRIVTAQGVPPIGPDCNPRLLAFIMKARQPPIRACGDSLHGIRLNSRSPHPLPLAASPPSARCASAPPSPEGAHHRTTRPREFAPPRIRPPHDFLAPPPATRASRPPNLVPPPAPLPARIGPHRSFRPPLSACPAYKPRPYFDPSRAPASIQSGCTALSWPSRHDEFLE